MLKLFIIYGANAVHGKRKQTNKTFLTLCLSKACGLSGLLEENVPWWDLL